MSKGKTVKDAARRAAAIVLAAIIFSTVPTSGIFAAEMHRGSGGSSSASETVVACSHYGELYRTENAGDSWTKLPREFTEIRALSWTPN